jgi:hypothetical protein
MHISGPSPICNGGNSRKTASWCPHYLLNVRADLDGSQGPKNSAGMGVYFKVLAASSWQWGNKIEAGGQTAQHHQRAN